MSTRRHSDERPPLDYSPSSGAVGSTQKSYDWTAPTENDGRSDTVTGFDPSDTSSDRIYRHGEFVDRWRHLNSVNEHGYGDNEKRNTHADAHRDLAVVADTLELTRLQRERAHTRLMAIDDFRIGASSEAIVLAVATLAANVDDVRIRSHDEFDELRQALGVTRRQIRNVRKRL